MTAVQSTNLSITSFLHTHAFSAFDPPELPPHVLVVSYGLLVMPYRWLLDSSHMHSSLVLVTPRGMAPALLSRATAGASVLATKSAREIRPVEHGIPERHEWGGRRLVSYPLTEFRTNKSDDKKHKSTLNCHSSSHKKIINDYPWKGNNFIAWLLLIYSTLMIVLPCKKNDSLTDKGTPSRGSRSARASSPPVSSSISLSTLAASAKAAENLRDIKVGDGWNLLTKLYSKLNEVFSLTKV